MTVTTISRGPAISGFRTSFYEIPTVTHLEADATLSWTKTMFVVVEAESAGKMGLGYAYATRAAAELIHATLAKQVIGAPVFDIPAIRQKLIRVIRDHGRSGIAATAISMIDSALWDLKARILDLPLASVLGQVRSGVPVYGSGGFTSFSLDELERHFEGWIAMGLTRVKMKVGGDPEGGADLERVRLVRNAIGIGPELFVDADGVYRPKRAMEMAERFSDFGVSWFEEPVSSEDLTGLRALRERAPFGIEIAAGEYGYDHGYFLRMLQSGSVDVLQADATRCGGFSGFLEIGALCEAFGVPLSANGAPSLHLHVCAAVNRVRNLEYSYDHVGIEKMLFDGFIEPQDGLLYPDLSRPGLGIELKKSDALRFAA
ncbi:MAG TPA: enolase C-terminal domain-like protein [Bdellovibrionota bacterium]|nr:enolase C-terminal domain-like protein [Bdellovibrionota bacterium]